MTEILPIEHALDEDVSIAWRAMPTDTLAIIGANSVMARKAYNGPHSTGGSVHHMKQLAETKRSLISKSWLPVPRRPPRG